MSRIHHVTAMVGRRCITKNYHLYYGDQFGYYGDQFGHPCTILTFFPWKSAAPERATRRTTALVQSSKRTAAATALGSPMRAT
jgi:hypothetical protein